MGNKIARMTQVSATEYNLHDLPSSYNLILKEVLGRGRFFKSVLCKNDEGLVLVKVYFKRGENIDLREYERRLSHIKGTFRGLDHPHVWPFQFWQETDKAAYDYHIAGIYLHIEPLDCGWGKVEEIRRNIVDFKKSGKFITMYVRAFMNAFQ